MKTHFKVVVISFMTLGFLTLGLIALFLILTVLSHFGIMHGGGPDMDAGTIVLVCMILGVPALWCLRVADGLRRRRAFYRLWAIIISGILFIGLNLVILVPALISYKAGWGQVTFHLVFIAFGVYTIAVLLSKDVKEQLANPKKPAAGT